MGRQLHALSFAAGECCRRLAKPQVAQAYFIQHPQFFHNLRVSGKELQSFFNSEVQHFKNILAVVADFQHLRFVTRAFALLAHQFDVRQELHFDRHRSVALAGFAASARNIEREIAGAEAALFRFRQGSKQFPDGVERFYVGNRIRSRRASNGRLVDQDHIVDVLVAFQAAPKLGWRHGFLMRLVFGRRKRPEHHVVQKRGLAGTRNSGDRNQHPQRDRQINLFQVVRTRAEDFDLLPPRRSPVSGHLNAQFIRQVSSRKRSGDALDFIVTSSGHHFSATLARSRTKIKNPV